MAKNKKNNDKVVFIKKNTDKRDGNKETLMKIRFKSF